MATYAFFPVMWLATLVLASRWSEPGPVGAAMAAWLLLAVSFGSGGLPPPWNAIWTTTQTVLTFAFIAATARSLATSNHVPASRSSAWATA